MATMQSHHLIKPQPCHKIEKAFQTSETVIGKDSVDKTFLEGTLVASSPLFPRQMSLSPAQTGVCTCLKMHRGFLVLFRLPFYYRTLNLLTLNLINATNITALVIPVKLLLAVKKIKFYSSLHYARPVNYTPSQETV